MFAKITEKEEVERDIITEKPKPLLNCLNAKHLSKDDLGKIFLSEDMIFIWD